MSKLITADYAASLIKDEMVVGVGGFVGFGTPEGTTCGTIGAEGRLIRSNCIPMLIYCALTVLILGGAILMGANPFPLG